MRTGRPRALLCATACLLFLAGCEVKRDEVKNASWQTYGNDNTSSTDWTGGDGAHSVRLPNGDVVWMFGDTFAGEVTPTNPPRRDGAANRTMSHNSYVIERNGRYVQTRLTPIPAQQLLPGEPASLIWPRDGTVEGGKLKVLVGSATNGSRQGAFVATLSLPGLVLEGVQSTPSSNSTTRIGWGINVYEDGNFTYIYGTYQDFFLQFDMYVARAPAGNIRGTWQYFNSSTGSWSSDEAQATRIGHVMEGAVTSYGTNRYVMVGKDGNGGIAARAIVACPATTPYGPFTNGCAELYRPPEQGDPGNPEFETTYATHLHHHDITGDGILLGYSHGPGAPADIHTDVRIYRPKFIRIKPASGAGGSASFVATPDAASDQYRDPLQEPGPE